MHVPDWKGPLAEAFDQATDYLAGLPDRPVGPEATAEELHKEFGGPLPEQPHDPRLVVRSSPPRPSRGLLPAAAGGSSASSSVAPHRPRWPRTG